MAEDKEELTISNCPKCPHSHTYKLEIQRSISLGYINFGSPETRGQLKFFTRLFTCPVTREDFQARFPLFEEANSQIEFVEVKNLVKESNDESRST